MCGSPEEVTRLPDAHHAPEEPPSEADCIPRPLHCRSQRRGSIRRRPDLDPHARVCGRMRSPCASFVSLENGLRELILLFYGAPSPTFWFALKTRNNASIVVIAERKETIFGMGECFR